MWFDRLKWVESKWWEHSLGNARDCSILFEFAVTSTFQLAKGLTIQIHISSCSSTDKYNY